MTARTVWGFWVPATFWDDHADRAPSDLGQAGICREDRRAGQRVRIAGKAEQVECLRSDAKFYCDRDGPDQCPRSIKDSARRTLDIIDQIYKENPALRAEVAALGVEAKP